VQPMREMVGHTSRVNSVAYSPKGDLIASGSDDKTVRIWSVPTGGLP
jgi:WD40 repeat protein